MPKEFGYGKEAAKKTGKTMKQLAKMRKKSKVHPDDKVLMQEGRL